MSTQTQDTEMPKLPPDELAMVYAEADAYAQAHPELLDTLALQGLGDAEARAAIMITLARRRVAELAAQKAEEINALVASEQERSVQTEALEFWNGERPLTDAEIDALVAMGTPPTQPVPSADYFANIDQATALIDVQSRAVWTTAYQNDLPDSSFAYIEPGGHKDSGGRTTPRTLRHLPYKDKNGKVDAAHLKNALARLNQTHISAGAKASALRKLRAAAKGVGVKTAAA